LSAIMLPSQICESVLPRDGCAESLFDFFECSVTDVYLADFWLIYFFSNFEM